MKIDEAYRPIVHVLLLILVYFLVYWMLYFTIPEFAAYLLFFGWIVIVILSVFLMRGGQPGGQRTLSRIMGWILIVVFLVMVIFTFMIWLGSL